ncbi:MAG: orotidine-5'-phosphate decarboxylase [Deltaproteobacteria bacterium]|nr:orotidine-5'-phosphate decarboxylase [Deltaproteobacteria bacterium]
MNRIPEIKNKTGRDYIIFPLDVPSVDQARHYIGLLADYVGMFKVGLELFIRSGPELIRLIRDSGSAGIFLDLKLHDIPVTVSRAMESIADLGVDLATVHCGENAGMLEAAVEGSHGRVGVLGVTVLTSVGSDDIRRAGFRQEFSESLSALVLKRAAMAKSAGCTGVICSGLEVKTIKQHLGKNFLAVTPGIRPGNTVTGRDDQRRITTPAQAVQSGSDYLVIGRPIRDADNPCRAAGKIAREIENALTI